jgi:hypothetical protein
MDVTSDLTDRGMPRVKWTALIPKTTQGNRLWKQATIGFAVAGGIVGLFANGIPGLLFGAFFGGGFGAYVFNRSMQQQHQQEWAVKPVVVESKGEAFIGGSLPDGLAFNWYFETPDGELLGDTIPLSSFDVFEFGSMNEWFAGADDKKKFGDCLAIVVDVEHQGTKCVAVHAGSKADMARLHGALTREFIAKRRALIHGARSEAAPELRAPLRDDVPKSL